MKPLEAIQAHVHPRPVCRLFMTRSLGQFIVTGTPVPSCLVATNAVQFLVKYCLMYI